MRKKRSIVIHPIETIGQFVDFFERQSGLLWFRGNGMSTRYKLKPALYKTKEPREWVGLYEKEYDMIRKFRQKSIPFVGDRTRDDDLDILFFMQHYHIPTKLLDWSANSNVALYFTLHAANNFDGNEGYIDYCAVWVLNHISWNRASLKMDRANKILSHLRTILWRDAFLSRVRIA